MEQVTVPLSRDSEADLLHAAAQGRAEAVRWLLDEVAPVVHGFLWARVGGDQAVAEDLLQETLLQAMALPGDLSESLNGRLHEPLETCSPASTRPDR